MPSNLDCVVAMLEVPVGWGLVMFLLWVCRRFGNDEREPDER